MRHPKSRFTTGNSFSRRVPRRRPRLLTGLGALGIGTAASLMATGPVAHAATSAAVTPPPGPTTPLVFGAAKGQQLSLSAGVTHGPYSADPYENKKAVASARKLLGAEPIFQNQAIEGFGVGNPEPSPGVYNWTGLDRRMATIKATGGVPVITLVGAPDWMKGGQPGTTNYSEVPYAPTPQHYRDFANLAVQVARRYPQVHRFIVWNEMKGFWDNRYSRWNYIAYTQMYNMVYDALKAYNPKLQVGGPYVTIESDAYTSTPPAGTLYGKWGAVDPRSLQVLTYWLTHKHGADFIAVDARAATTKGGLQTDEFTAAEKFAAVDQWIRQRTALPIWWSEFYDQPPGTSWTDPHQAAAITTTLAEMAMSGAAVALMWAPEADAQNPSKRAHLWTYAGAGGGGQPTPLYYSYENFNKYFSGLNDHGTPADNVSVVVNPTDHDLTWEGHTLSPYGVAYVTGSAVHETASPPAQGGTGAPDVSAGAASPDTIGTLAGGAGSGIAMHVSQVPTAVAVTKTATYVADPSSNVVRGVDLTQTTPTKRLESVVAGTGQPGYSGDGGLAQAAHLNDPEGVATDAAGNVYISDANNNRIRRVGTDGIITTVAGNGVFGHSGDGGRAVDAHIEHPTGIAVDPSGNVYFVEVDGDIRKVTPGGIITTVAGNGTAGYSGDGGPATHAQLQGPGGIAFDAHGDLLIADTGNQRVRKVTPAGVISTVAGTGARGFSGDGGAATKAKLSSPASVAVGANGYLYIADDGNQRVRRVAPDGRITTVAGDGTAGFSGDGGTATSAELSEPTGVAVGPDGNLWIADRDNRRVRMVNTSDVITSPIGGGLLSSSGDGAVPTAAEVNRPVGVAVDAKGDVYFSDELNHRVRKISPSGIITTVAGNGSYGFSGDGGPATSAELWSPMGLAVDSAGNLYIADYYNNRVRKVTPSGTISTVVGYGTYGFAGDGGGATKAWMEGPVAVAVDGAGNLYVVDSGNQRVRKVTAGQGRITTVAGDGVAGTAGDSGPATSAELDNPSGVAVNAAGDVYIAESLSNRVQMVAPDGTITTVAGDGVAGFGGDGGAATSAELAFPSDVAVDPAGGFYIADAGNSRIRYVNAKGVITTVAGTGAFAYAGDGGPANWAPLSDPGSVAVAPNGALVIADTDNARIREVK